MAKVITDEKIKLSIVIDGNVAQKELGELENKIRDLNVQQKELRKEKQLLEKQGLKETERYKAVTASIKENSLAITANKTRMSELQKEVGLMGLTLGQLQSKAIALKTVLRGMIPGTENYKNVKAELAQVTDRIADLSGKAKTAKTSIGSLADSFNRYQAIGISVIAALTGVALSIAKIIDLNGKLSDAQADVMKTTGMTKKEVDELTKSFGLLQTRTSRIDLLKIAEQGGRIGIAKEEIGQFVDVMNKAAVSLGDSFTGGVEEVANKLGKLKFLFKETKDLSIDKAYNAIGSAINDLGAYGIASEANIAEFATRLGSLTDVMKPSIQQTLALGAAFEESGVEAEISSRAYGIVLKEAATKSAKFAEVMRLSKTEVESLINTNPLEFMLKFAEGMKGMSGTQIAKTLDYLGIAANGAEKAIGAMGNNTARFRELIDLSNNSFSAGVSLINEYNIKNETLGATLDRIKKTVMTWFSSETFTKWLASAALWFAKFIGAADDADGSVAKWRTTLAFTAKIIAVVIASLISYSAATRVAALVSNGITASTALFNIALRLQTLYLSLQQAALLIYTGVMGFFGIATDKASASLARLNLVSKLSPWGALFAVITAVTVAYIAFSASTVKAASAQETFAKQQKELAATVAKQTADTKANLASLISLIKDENVSMSTRKKAYEELVKISPIFNGYLVDEKFNIAGLVTIYGEYLKALDKVTYARQFNRLNEGNIKKQILAQQELFNAEKKLQEEKSKAEKAYASSAGATNINRNELLNSQGIIDAKKALIDAKANLINANELVSGTNSFREAQIKALTDSIAVGESALKTIANKSSEEFKKVTIKLQSDKAALEAIIGKTPEGQTKSPFKVMENKDAAGAQKQFKTQEEINKQFLESELKYAAEVLKNERQLEDDRISVMKDGAQKENVIEKLRYERRIEDLEKQKVHEDEMAKLDAELSKAKKDGDIKYYKFLEQQKLSWKEKNKNLDQQINQIEENEAKIHKMKMGIIENNAIKKEVDEEKHADDIKKAIRETQFYEELAALGDNEIAKEKLKKDFAESELKNDKEDLETKIAQLQRIMSGSKIDGFDFSLLSDEDKKKMEEDLTFMKLALAKIKAAQTEEKTGLDKFGEAAKNAFGETDILGFTPKQWEDTFKNLSTLEGMLSASNMVVSAMQNLWGQFAAFQTASENRDLRNYQKTADSKKLKLKQQLDAGLINQSQYRMGIKKLDDDYEKKKIDLEYKQAKREKTMAIVSAVISTAKGVASALPNLFLAAIAATVGALQIATIAAQPLPSKGAEKGLYPEYIKREQDGKVFKTTGTSSMTTGLYSKPRLLVGEGPGDTPEMVIDKRSYAQLSPATKNALIRELQGVRGFEQGYYNDKAMRYEVPSSSPDANSSSNTSDKMMMMIMNVISENTAVMKDLRDNPIAAIVNRNDKKSMSEIEKGIKEYNELRNKSKK